MRMKEIKNILMATATLIMVFTMSSCIKENIANDATDKVNVTLHFDTRADGTTSPVDTDNNEGIKTLRVVIADADNNNNVIANIWKDYSSDTNPDASKNLTIIGLEPGDKNFYVVINEASLGLQDGWDGITIGESLPDAFLQKVITNTENAIYFPKTSDDIAKQGIPATGNAFVSLTSQEDQSVTISCTHAVAKIVLNVTNHSGKPFTLQGVTFGEFFQQGTYLFDKEGGIPDNMKVPEGGNFPGLKKEIAVTSESGGTPTEALVCYLFETGNNMTEDKFTVALDVEGMDFLKTPAKIQFNGSMQNQLPRGYMLNLNAIVTGSEITYGPVTVEPWTSQTVELE